MFSPLSRLVDLQSNDTEYRHLQCQKPPEHQEIRFFFISNAHTHSGRIANPPKHEKSTSANFRPFTSTPIQGGGLSSALVVGAVDLNILTLGT